MPPEIIHIAFINKFKFSNNLGIILGRGIVKYYENCQNPEGEGKVFENKHQPRNHFSHINIFQDFKIFMYMSAKIVCIYDYNLKMATE